MTAANNTAALRPSGGELEGPVPESVPSYAATRVPNHRQPAGTIRAWSRATARSPIYSLLLAAATGAWLATALAGATDFPPLWVAAAVRRLQPVRVPVRHSLALGRAHVHGAAAANRPAARAEPPGRGRDLRDGVVPLAAVQPRLQPRLDHARRDPRRPQRRDDGADGPGRRLRLRGRGRPPSARRLRHRRPAAARRARARGAARERALHGALLPLRRPRRARAVQAHLHRDGPGLRARRRAGGAALQRPPHRRCSRSSWR